MENCVWREGDRASVMWEILAPVQTIKAVLDGTWSICFDGLCLFLASRQSALAETLLQSHSPERSAAIISAQRRLNGKEQLGWKFDILGYIHACDLGFCWLTVPINDKWGSGWTNYIYSFYRSRRNHGRQVSWKCTCLCSLSTSSSLTNHKSSSYSTGILPRRCSSNEKRCSQMAGHIFGGMWLKMRGKWKGHSFSRIIRNLFISEGYSKSIWTQNGWSLVTFLIGVPALTMHNVSVYILPRVFLSL